MATVKSLEERLDEFSDEFGGVKVQLETTSTELTSCVIEQKALQSRVAEMIGEQKAIQTQLHFLQTQLQSLTSQLASVVNTQNTTQAQLAVATSKFDGLTDNLKISNNRIDEAITRIEKVNNDHTALKSRSEYALGLGKWLGSSAFAAFIVILGSAFGIARYMGMLDSSIQQQQKTLDEIRLKIK